MDAVSSRITNNIKPVRLSLEIRLSSYLLFLFRTVRVCFVKYRVSKFAKMYQHYDLVYNVYYLPDFTTALIEKKEEKEKKNCIFSLLG
jgi:hypothetical protein